MLNIIIEKMLRRSHKCGARSRSPNYWDGITLDNREPQLMPKSEDLALYTRSHTPCTYSACYLRLTPDSHMTCTLFVYVYVYHRVPSECPPSFICPPPPIFPHRKNWYRECAPPRLSAPAPPFPSVLLPVISHPTLPPCIMKCQNVRDISRGTWPTIVSAFTTLTA